MQTILFLDNIVLLNYIRENVQILTSCKSLKEFV
jgi:hypothetical protein